MQAYVRLNVHTTGELLDHAKVRAERRAGATTRAKRAKVYGIDESDLVEIELGRRALTDKERELLLAWLGANEVSVMGAALSSLPVGA